MYTLTSPSLFLMSCDWVNYWHFESICKLKKMHIFHQDMKLCLKGLCDIYNTNPSKNTTKQILPWLSEIVFAFLMLPLFVRVHMWLYARPRFRSDVAAADAETSRPLTQRRRADRRKADSRCLGQQPRCYPHGPAMRESVIPVAIWLVTWFYGDDTTSKSFSSNL